MDIALPAVQLVGRQSTFRGGWPRGFIGSTCDGDAPVKCQPYSIYNLNCCPADQKCSTGWPPYCCPTEESCETVVANLPACANSTWNMYKLDRGGSIYYFCCPQAMVGIIPSTGHTGICQEKVANIPNSILATVASQFGGSAVETVAGTPTGGTGGANGPGTINTPSGGDDTSSGSSNNSPTGREGGQTTGGSNAGSTSGGDSGGGGGGISAGAIAGIVIGSLAFFTIAIALVLWIHRRSLRRNPPGASSVQYAPPPEPPKPTAPVVAQVHPMAPSGGDAPGAMGYPGSSGPGNPNFTLPQHSSATTAPTPGPPHVSGFDGLIHAETPPPQDAAPAYSPPQHVPELAGAPRAEMEAPRA